MGHCLIVVFPTGPYLWFSIVGAGLLVATRMLYERKLLAPVLALFVSIGFLAFLWYALIELAVMGARLISGLPH